jgi:hypothetical protein
MSAGELPRPLIAALAAIHEATLAVIAATGEEDTGALDTALERRSLAIRGLEPVLDDCRHRLTPGQRRRLDEVGEALSRQGCEAEKALGEILRRTRSALSSFEKEAEAVRRYAASPLSACALDQSA